MYVYRKNLYKSIICSVLWKMSRYGSNSIESSSVGLHKLAQEAKDVAGIVFNYNEEGRLHSKYLDDRYEPAITLYGSYCLIHYYLFDGEIKDCIHPVSIKIYATEKHIDYYSSERIKQELPININKQKHIMFETYNYYSTYDTILCGYKKGRFEIKLANYVEHVEQDYTLHERMESAMPFKFAD